MNARDAVRAAIAERVIGGRLWLYSNYHCNLTCTYCLTESAPRVARRELPLESLQEIATEARANGFTALGVTGGEPFLLPGLPRALAAMSVQLPTLVLTNATLFTPRLLDQLAPLAGPSFAVQVSLDSADEEVNDRGRGAGNFARVVAALPMLRSLGIRVRLATTSDSIAEGELARLCALHRSLGVPDEDHVVRPVVRRGRAREHGMGVEAGVRDLPPELTVTADGAFWSPFGPTVQGGRLDTDLLITRTARPLSIPAAAMVRIAGGQGPQRGDQLKIC